MAGIVIICIIVFAVKAVFGGGHTGTLKCNSCKREFSEHQVFEWLDDYDNEDDEGKNPCCPYCGSDDVSDL